MLDSARCAGKEFSHPIDWCTGLLRVKEMDSLWLKLIEPLPLTTISSFSLQLEPSWCTAWLTNIHTDTYTDIDTDTYRVHIDSFWFLSSAAEIMKERSNGSNSDFWSNYDFWFAPVSWNEATKTAYLDGVPIYFYLFVLPPPSLSGVGFSKLIIGCYRN